VEAFIEFLYLETTTLKKAYDCLSALCYFLPMCNLYLKVSRKMVRIWQSEEPPERPVGLTPEAVLGLAGFCARLHLQGMAAILLAGFDCFFRTGELFSLTVGAVEFIGDGEILRLDSTKGLQRALTVNTLSEVVVVESKLAIKWLKKACKGKSSDALLLGIPAATCRKLFSLIEALGLKGKLSFYSLRRGGASWYFLQTNNMDKTAIRGRWAHTATARVYVQSCLAEKQRLQLTPEQRQCLAKMAKFLLV